MYQQLEQTSVPMEHAGGSIPYETRVVLFKRGRLDDVAVKGDFEAIQRWWDGGMERGDMDIATLAVRAQAIAYLSRKGCGIAQAEDVYAESCLRVLKALHGGCQLPRRCFRSFMYRTLLTTWLMSTRASSREVLQEEPDALVAVEERCDSVEQAIDTISHCISVLPSPLAALIHHHYYCKKSFKDFAELTSRNTVAVCRLHTQALTNLYECLKKQGVELPGQPTRVAMRHSQRGKQS